MASVAHAASCSGCRQDSLVVGIFKVSPKEEGRRKKEEGRRKKEEGRRKKEEGRRKKEEGRSAIDTADSTFMKYTRLSIPVGTRQCRVPTTLHKPGIRCIYSFYFQSEPGNGGRKSLEFLLPARAREPVK